MFGPHDYALQSVRLRLFLLLTAFSLSACQHRPQSFPATELDSHLGAQHAQHVQTIQSFQLKSKIAIQHQSKGYSGRLHWQHQPEYEQLQILSPFGQQIAIIESRPLQTLLIDQQQRIHTASSIETLTQDLYGWSLPIQGMPYWVLGLSAPGDTAQPEYNIQGQLLLLNQQGWEIRFDDYRAVFSENTQQSYQLPHSLEMRRLIPANQPFTSNLRIKLLMTHWQLASVTLKQLVTPP